MGKGKGKNTANTPTNGWDIVKTIVDGIFGMMSINKAAAFVVFWFVIRDIIYVSHLPEDFDYASRLLNYEFFEYLVENENILITTESAIIIFLLVACIGLISYCILLRKEISRMADVRSQAIHGKEKIRIHSTSNI